MSAVFDGVLESHHAAESRRIVTLETWLNDGIEKLSASDLDYLIAELSVERRERDEANQPRSPF